MLIQVLPHSRKIWDIFLALIMENLKKKYICGINDIKIKKKKTYVV